MKKTVIIPILLLLYSFSYSQNLDCCKHNEGYKNFIIKTNNNVEIGFKLQKRTNNEKGNNIYSVIAYAKNNNTYKVRNIRAAKFKIIGVSQRRIPGVKYVLDVSLTMGLDAHSSEVVIGTIYSVQEPSVELNGFLYGIYKKLEI